MCRKWPQMARVGMQVCWRMCVYSLNATRIGTLLAFGVGYIRAYYSRQEQRQPLARYCLYLPASMGKHDRTHKTRKSGCQLQCLVSVSTISQRPLPRLGEIQTIHSHQCPCFRGRTLQMTHYCFSFRHMRGYSCECIYRASEPPCGHKWHCNEELAFQGKNVAEAFLFKSY